MTGWSSRRAESSPRPGRRGRARRRRRRPRRLDTDAGRRSGRQARGADLPPAGQGLRPHARGGRGHYAEAGADLAGFILVEDSPRRRGRRPAGAEAMLSVAVHVGEYEDRAPTSCSSTSSKRARSAAVTPCFCRTARWSLGRSTCPGRGATRSTSPARRVPTGAGRLGPDNVRRAIEAVRRGPSTRPPSSSASRESRIPTRCAPGGGEMTTGLYGTYGGRYVPRRSSRP